MANSTAQEEQEAQGKPDKDVVIIVNAEEKTVESDIVTFDEVTSLAYPTPPYADTLYTVTYRNAKNPKEGSLVEGQSVEVKKHGTIFNVTATDKS
jgi:Multiubiquitin